MAYNNNTPLANQRLNATQAPIKDNFAGIKTLVDVNHETFDIADQGKHKFLQMPEQGAAPTTAANEGGLYTKENTTTTVTELYFRRESDGSELPLTGGNNAANSGWAYGPNGLIFKWSTEVVGGGVTNGTVNANAFGPAYTTLYNIQMTIKNASGGCSASIIGTQFNWVVGDAGTDFQWFAIGA